MDDAPALRCPIETVSVAVSRTVAGLDRPASAEAGPVPLDEAVGLLDHDRSRVLSRFHTRIGALDGVLFTGIFTGVFCVYAALVFPGGSLVAAIGAVMFCLSAALARLRRRWTAEAWEWVDAEVVGEDRCGYRWSITGSAPSIDVELMRVSRGRSPWGLNPATVAVSIERTDRANFETEAEADAYLAACDALLPADGPRDARRGRIEGGAPEDAGASSRLSARYVRRPEATDGSMLGTGRASIGEAGGEDVGWA